MFDATQIGYELEIQESVLSADIAAEHPDSVLVWLTGACLENGMGTYSYVLEYRGTKKFFHGETPTDSANMAMLVGLADAVSQIKKPSNICVISVAPLGITHHSTKRKELTQKKLAVIELLMQKQCTLTDILYEGGSAEIKKLLAVSDSSGSFARKLEEKQEKAVKSVSDYKLRIYAEALSKVKRILEENGVNPNIIGQIMDIQP